MLRLWSWGAVVGGLMALAEVAQGTECTPLTLGLDPSEADTAVFAFETRGQGQVFYAPDTLIRAITIWRPPLPAYNDIPYRIWILGVDSTGRPDELQLLLAGPVVVNPNGDGVHPVPYRFVFDPPFAVARPGQYFFDIISADCIAGPDILADTSNVYTDGQAWRTGASTFCEGPGGPQIQPDDLCFEVEFCVLGTTPVVGDPPPGSDTAGSDESDLQFRTFGDGAHERVELFLAAPAHVRIAVYDVLGRLVAVLADEGMGKGWFRCEWDGRSRHGSRSGSGLYYVRARIVREGRGVERFGKSLIIR